MAQRAYRRMRVEIEIIIEYFIIFIQMFFLDFRTTTILLKQRGKVTI